MSDRFDVLVIGAGVAGMSVVHSLQAQAPQLRVGLVTLQAPGQAGATPWAQGGVAVAWGQDDSPALHTQDTLAAGAGLCRQDAVDALTSEGPLRIQELLELGADFDKHADGTLELTREAAHQRRRVVHCGDASGREMARALARALPESVELIYGQMTQPGRCRRSGSGPGLRGRRPATRHGVRAVSSHRAGGSGTRRQSAAAYRSFARRGCQTYR